RHGDLFGHVLVVHALSSARRCTQLCASRIYFVHRHALNARFIHSSAFPICPCRAPGIVMKVEGTPAFAALSAPCFMSHHASCSALTMTAHFAFVITGSRGAPIKMTRV